MAEQLKIFTDKLRNHQREKINLVLSPDFLDLSEKEVQTPTSVTLKGEAYCLDDLLMITLDVSTEIKMPCAICNNPTCVPLQNKDILLSFPLSELPSTVFDYTQFLREEVVMLIPQFIECKKRGCPQRQELQPYLKKENHHFPFAEL